MHVAERLNGEPDKDKDKDKYKDKCEDAMHVDELWTVTVPRYYSYTGVNVEFSIN